MLRADIVRWIVNVIYLPKFSWKRVPLLDGNAWRECATHWKRLSHLQHKLDCERANHKRSAERTSFLSVTYPYLVGVNLDETKKTQQALSHHLRWYVSQQQHPIRIRKLWSRLKEMIYLRENCILTSVLTSNTYSSLSSSNWFRFETIVGTLDLSSRFSSSGNDKFSDESGNCLMSCDSMTSVPHSNGTGKYKQTCANNALKREWIFLLVKL